MWHTTPSSPSKIWHILIWNNSGALEIPNGSLLKEYRPNGVIKVVNWWDSLAKRTCQNPELASNFVKIFVLPNWHSVWSTEGKINFFRLTALFNFVRSTHILTVLSVLSTGTIQEHQSLGRSTFWMMSSFSILDNSSLTLSVKGTGIHLATFTEYGVALGCNLILYSSFSSPKPVKSSVYLAWHGHSVMLSSLGMRLRLSMACPPKSGAKRFLIT